MQPNYAATYLNKTPIASTNNSHLTKVTNHYFFPQTHVNVSSSNGMDSKQLASEINKHVDNSLRMHYSTALSDATRRE